MAALYRDWETLATNSGLIGGQKKSQQRNILKLLFGVYQEKTQTKEAGDRDNSDPQESDGKIESSSENNPENRSQVDIRTLNSVIQDIFPDYQENKEVFSNAQDEDLKGKAPEDTHPSYDLSYLDLRDLDLSQKVLRHASLKGAHLESADLWGTHLEGADMRRAHLGRADLWEAHLEGANLRGAHLEGANLQAADLEGTDMRRAHLGRADLWEAHLGRADLWEAHLERANMQDADLEGADLWRADLKGANLQDAHLEDTNLQAADLQGTDLLGVCLKDASFFAADENIQDANVRERVINQLKKAEYLPGSEELLKAKGFDQALVDDIIKAHEEHHKDNQQ